MVPLDSKVLPPLESFWEHREYFRSCMRRFHRPGTAEGADAYEAPPPITPLNERLIQAVWANQLLQPEGLKLCDGRPLRVLDAGRWNGEAGPDFRSARLIIGERERSGDVEIHLQGSQWRAHRHEADLEFNTVILHVILKNDDGRTEDPLHNGDVAPRLEIEPYVFPDLETIRRSMTPDDFPYGRTPSLGKCYELMTTLDADHIRSFLDKAGDERLKAKVRRIEDQATDADPEQVFYQSLMMALGAGASRSLYYLLAKRTPLAELFDHAGEMPPERRVRGLESILMHVAGLVPPAGDMAEAPPEAQSHAALLGEEWKRFEPYWSDRVIAPTRRWYQGLRPANFATRRLSAVAHLLADALESGRPLLEDLADGIAESTDELSRLPATRRIHPVVRNLVARFCVSRPESFWAKHYSFTANPAPRPMVLMGEATARSLVFNAVIPAVSLLARQRDDPKLAAAIERLYSIFPRLPFNQITGFMAKRLFGETTRAKNLITTERRHQGLFQIFHACCQSEERHCDSCYFFSED